MVVRALAAHKQRANGADVGGIDNQDIVADLVADALRENRLVAARAAHAVDYVVGDREIVGGVVQIQTALQVELTVADIVNQVVVVDVVASRTPGLYRAGVLRILIDMVDVVVGDAVVPAMQEAMPIFPGDAGNAFPQRLVTQPLDRGTVARHVVNMVMEHLVMAALADLHAVAVPDKPPAVVDVVIFHPMMMIHVRLPRRQTGQRNAMKAVEAYFIAVNNNPLGVGVYFDTGRLRVLDAAEAKRAILRARHRYHVPVRDAQVQPLEMDVADGFPRCWLPLKGDQAGRGGNDHRLRGDGRLPGPAVDGTLAAADMRLSRRIQQCQHVFDKVPVAAVHGVAFVAAHGQRAGGRVDAFHWLVLAEPVLAGPDKDARVGQVGGGKAGRKVARAIHKGRPLLPLHGGFQRQITAVRRARQFPALTILKKLPGQPRRYRVRQGGPPDVFPIRLPSRYSCAADKRRPLGWIGGVGDGESIGAGILRSQRQAIRQIISSRAHQHPHIARQAFLSSRPHRIARSNKRGKGAVGAACIGRGKPSRPGIAALRRDIKISGGLRACSRGCHTGRQNSQHQKETHRFYRLSPPGGSRRACRSSHCLRA